MSRITKDIASAIAKKLIQKKQDAVNKLNNEFAKKAGEYYLKTLPEKVIKAFEDDVLKKYIDTTTSIRLSGHGWNYQYVPLDKNYPDNRKSVQNFTPKQMEILLKMYNDHSTAKNELNDLKSKIEIALYNLKTYSRVSESFPEAIPHLPTNSTTAVSVNVLEIRNELNA